ncbi:MAG: class I SAM-dependent methyltransferase [Gaiellaceae bacterium]
MNPDCVEAPELSWLARYLEWRERRHPDPVLREHRRKLLAGIAGHVLELGCGSGVNFEHYGPEVARVVAFEPDPRGRALARTRAAEAPVAVQVLDARAESLPIEDESFDAAVCFGVLCSVSDQARALAELGRVLRPGGELRFYEHVRSHRRELSLLQDAVDAAGWPGLLYGCHTGRDTEAAIRASGFEIVGLRRFFRASSLLTVPAGPQIAGLAIRP